MIPRRFGPFDRFFISDEQWQTMREDFFQQSGLPQRGEDAAEYLKEGLSRTYDQFLESLPGDTYARIDGNCWHLSVDSAEPLATSEELKLEQFKDWLKKHQRKIKLPVSRRRR